MENEDKYQEGYDTGYEQSQKDLISGVKKALNQGEDAEEKLERLEEFLKKFL